MPRLEIMGGHMPNIAQDIARLEELRALIDGLEPPFPSLKSEEEWHEATAEFRRLSVKFIRDHILRWGHILPDPDPVTALERLAIKLRLSGLTRKKT